MGRSLCSRESELVARIRNVPTSSLLLLSLCCNLVRLTLRFRSVFDEGHGREVGIEGRPSIESPYLRDANTGDTQSQHWQTWCAHNSLHCNVS